jgi:hypothetical protein
MRLPAWRNTTLNQIGFTKWRGLKSSDLLMLVQPKFRQSLWGDRFTISSGIKIARVARQLIELPNASNGARVFLWDDGRIQTMPTSAEFMGGCEAMWAERLKQRKLKRY